MYCLTPTANLECDGYRPGIFLDRDDFRFFLAHLIAARDQYVTDQLFDQAKVFDDYVYLFFHDGDDIADAVRRWKEKQKNLPDDSGRRGRGILAGGTEK